MSHRNDRDERHGVDADMYVWLREICRRPTAFEHYTAPELWTDDHTSCRMLEHHLDPSSDVSSRNAPFIDRSAAWIVRRFDVAEGRRVADLGCGPGLYTARLAASGAEVTGVDLSECSLQYARERAQTEGLSIDYVRANYLDFESERRFDLVTLIMCDFCALSPEQRRTLLGRLQHNLNRPTARESPYTSPSRHRPSGRR